MYVHHRAARFASILLMLLLLCASSGWGVRVGTYLYTDADTLADEYRGGLIVEFAEHTPSLVIAYGRRYRKDRYSRKGTEESERADFKPFKARLEDGGRRAVFAALPPDHYDLVVLDEEEMLLWEGVDMLSDSRQMQSAEKRLADIRASLTEKGPGAVTWEAFFDSKQFERLESADGRSAVFLQQMRLGQAFAESGAPLKGSVHSIDVCWVEEAERDAGWQVITRQQLYREELEQRTFFRYHHVPALQGIRVGLRARTIGPVELPAPPASGNSQQ